MEIKVRGNSEQWIVVVKGREKGRLSSTTNILDFSNTELDHGPESVLAVHQDVSRDLIQSL